MTNALGAPFKIFLTNLAPYMPKINGTVEAATKNIKKIVQKMRLTYKDWQEKLPFSPHAYRTSIRQQHASKYSLIYGIEAVLPVEVEITSFQVLMEAEIEEAE